MRITAILLLFITGLSALIAGYGFVSDPTGMSLGITTAYLRHSPFTDFFIPGITLFIANGVLSIATALTAIARLNKFPVFIFFQGSILTVWIISQVMLVRDFNMLHLTFLSTGISLIIIGKRLRKLPSKIN
jgi:hypothetical protein